MGQREKLEDLGARWGLPYCPELELSYLRDLFAAELRESLAEAEASLARRTDAEALVRRGRLRRLTGDRAGAVADWRRVLESEPEHPEALQWLGEAVIGTDQAEAWLTRALRAGAGEAALYRGAARLLAGDKAGAARDLEAFSRRREASCLGRLLAGLAARSSKSAVAHFQAAAASDPSCSAAHLLRARAERSKARAAAAAEDALDAEPDYAHMALALADVGAPWDAFLERLSRFAFAPNRIRPVCVRFELEDLQYAPYHHDAVEKARALARAHPGRAWALALLGRALSRLPESCGSAAEALSCFDQAIAAAPRQGWLFAWRAVARSKSGDGQAALEDFSVCFRLQPFYYRAYAWRGSLLRRLGRVDDALADLERPVPVDGLYPFLLHERSLARRAARDWSGAAQELDNAFRLDPRYGWVHTVGRQPSAGESEAAIGELNAAVAAKPGCASLRVWRGQVRLRSGAVNEAFLDFDQAARCDPRHALARAWLGRAQLERGRYLEAQAELRRSLELEPGLWIARGWLAEAEAAGGDLKKGLSTLRGLLKDRPRAAWAHRLHAGLLLDAGGPKAALTAARRAVALEGRSADGHYLLARAYEEISDLPAAERSLERALTISPHHGRSYVLRARVRERAGRFDAVLKDYRVVLDQFPYLFNEEQRARVSALLNA